MRIPWVRRRQVPRQKQVIERYREWAEAAQKEADGLSWKLSLERTEQARRNDNQEMYISKLEGRILEVTAERDEALENRDEYLRQRDNARASHRLVLRHLKEAGKTVEALRHERDEALARIADLERALGQFSAGEAATDDTPDLCDCPVSVVNEHLTGYCGTARLEASKAGTLMSTDCTCPPGWKHRTADCPFNPNPEREHRQRYG